MRLTPRLAQLSALPLQSICIDGIIESAAQYKRYKIDETRHSYDTDGS
jgi:hypothetical protein